MKTTDIQKFLKKNKKQLLIALGAVVAIIAIWIVVKKILNKSSKQNQKEEAETETGQQVTPGLNFDELAKRMFNAWISTWGTDENEVYSILGMMNTQADWWYFQERYAAYWNSLPMYERIIHTTAGLGLSGRLISDFRRELNKNELKHCRDILTAKGITPDF